METLAFRAEQAGWIVPWLLAVAVALDAIAIERLLTLAFSSGPTARLGALLRGMLAEGDLGAALGSAAANRGAFARVALRVLRDALRGDEAREAAAAEALGGEVATLQRRLWLLPLLGSVAVLLGLLGTITGLVVPSCPQPTADATSKAVMLAHAISHALNATAGGLAVSVLSVVFAGVVTALVRRRIDALKLEARGLLLCLATHRGRLRLQRGAEVVRAPVEARGYRVV